VIQPTPGIKGIIKDKGTNIVTEAHYFLRKMRADKAVSASDKYFFV
jgi:hypothetical protein